MEDNYSFEYDARRSDSGKMVDSENLIDDPRMRDVIEILKEIDPLKRMEMT